MTLKQYLVVMGTGTLLAGAAVAMILTTVDPADTQSIVFAALYICLFLALTGLLSIIGFLLRVWLLRKDQLLSRQVLVAFRQAVLLSAVLVTALVLQSRSLLNLFNAVLIVVGLTLLEFFFITAKIMR
jgi:hypothetical protein